MVKWKMKTKKKNRKDKIKSNKTKEENRWALLTAPLRPLHRYGVGDMWLEGGAAAVWFILLQCRELRDEVPCESHNWTTSSRRKPNQTGDSREKLSVGDGDDDQRLNCFHVKWMTRL